MRNSRGTVERRSNLRFQPSTVRDSGVSKVRENESVGDVGRYGAEYIFRLDVSMRDPFLVNVVNSIEDLTYDPSYL